VNRRRPGIRSAAPTVGLPCSQVLPLTQGLARVPSRLLSLVLALVLELVWAALVPQRADARKPDPSTLPGDGVGHGVGHRVLLVPLAAEGLASADRERLTASLHAAFEHAEITALAPSKLDTCADDPCLRDLGRAHRASHVVQVEVVADGRDFVGELTVVAVAAEAPASIIDTGCQICGLAEFEDRLAARAVAARDLILAPPRFGRIELVGTPDRALVRIDGRPRGRLQGRLQGRLPFSAELDVGSHELIVSADAHYPQVVPIATTAGVTQRLELELEPKPRLAWHRPTGWALLGSGAASLVTGVALIAVHGSPASLRCQTGGRASDPEFVDQDGNCRWLRQTRGAGLGLTIVGLAATGAGVGLLIVDAKRSRTRRTERERRIGPELRIGAGLRQIDVQLRF
jgi:hypothetical protein